MQSTMEIRLSPSFTSPTGILAHFFNLTVALLLASSGIPPGSKYLNSDYPAHSYQLLLHLNLLHLENLPPPGFSMKELVIKTTYYHQTHPWPQLCFFRTPESRLPMVHSLCHSPLLRQGSWISHSRKLCCATCQQPGLTSGPLSSLSTPALFFPTSVRSLTNTVFFMHPNWFSSKCACPTSYHGSTFICQGLRGYGSRSKALCCQINN